MAATAFRLDCEYTKLVTPLLEFVYQVYSGWVGEGGGGKGGGGHNTEVRCTAKHSPHTCACTRTHTQQFMERFYQLMDNDNSGRLTLPELLDAFSKLTW